MCVSRLGILLNAESELVDLGWGPRVCISSRFPDGAVAAGLHTMLCSREDYPVREEKDQTSREAFGDTPELLLRAFPLPS